MKKRYNAPEIKKLGSVTKMTLKNGSSLIADNPGNSGHKAPIVS